MVQFLRLHKSWTARTNCFEYWMNYGTWKFEKWILHHFYVSIALYNIYSLVIKVILQILLMKNIPEYCLGIFKHVICMIIDVKIQGLAKSILASILSNQTFVISSPKMQFRNALYNNCTSIYRKSKKLCVCTSLITFFRLTGGDWTIFLY